MRGVLARFGLAAMAVAAATTAHAQQWEYTLSQTSGMVAMGSSMPQTSSMPSGSRTVRVSESEPGVHRVVERTPSLSSGNICIGRPRNARLEMSGGLQVLTIEPAVHGCPETRYVFQGDGSGWEEQKAGAEWVKTGGQLAGTQQVASSRAAPEMATAVAQPTRPAAVAPAVAVAAPSAPAPVAPAPAAQAPVAQAPVVVATAPPASIPEPPQRQPAVAASSHRRALVIGNDTYRYAPRLLNARSDARAMGLALERNGFQVTTLLDVDERAFKRVLRDFHASVQGGDEVVVFYSGHGIQIGGINYLIPVDMHGENEDQVRDEAVPLQRILDDVADKHARFMLAVVDACRDNPFKGSGSGRSLGGTRGLAPTTAATGQMIIYSAGSGQQALDRLGGADRSPNGLFTRVFLREMETPGVPIDRVLRNVRNEVVRMARTVGHEQTPALYDQTVGDFYLRPVQ